MKKILFQGDSITDSNRVREGTNANGRPELGDGYVLRIAQQLPNTDVMNRGISGNRIVDLYARWKPDALHLRPDAISILIGVNDTWHEFSRGNGVEVPRYATIFRLLLEWTQASLPGVKLILCEPFVLPCGHVGPGWREEIDQRRQVVKKLASDFRAAFVPFQETFDEAILTHPPEYWAEDGVHPTQAGYDLMADCWLRHANL